MRPLRLDSVLHLVDLSCGRLSMGCERSRSASKYSWHIYAEMYVCTRDRRRMRRETLGDSLRGRWRGYWSRNANPPRAECVLIGGAEVRFLVLFLSCVPGFRGSILALPRASLHSEQTSIPLVDRTGVEEEDPPHWTPSSTDRTSRDIRFWVSCALLLLCVPSFY